MFMHTYSCTWTTAALHVPLVRVGLRMRSVAGWDTEINGQRAFVGT